MSRAPKMKIADKVVRIEAKAAMNLLPRINANFDKACDLVLQSKGRVVLTGMGKPGFIAQKISATLSSTGTPSLYLHPADAIHGDLGRVVKEDVVVALSNSGETEEIVKILPVIKKIGSKLISLTGQLRSTLARFSDVALDVSVKKEACPLNLAPSASTTAMLVMGDALAFEVLERKGFKAEDFAFFHPGGSLGKKLLKVKDIMRTGVSNPVVSQTATVGQTLLTITKARAGCASIVNATGRFCGIFTDGDLRRALAKDPNVLIKEVGMLMTRSATSISQDRLAAEAMEVMTRLKIDEMPVLDGRGRPAGLLDVQDLLKSGII